LKLSYNKCKQTICNYIESERTPEPKRIINYVYYTGTIIGSISRNDIF